jgi:hypothetical protein
MASRYTSGMHFLLLPFVLSVADIPAARNPDIVVVCPADFRPAMQPWLTRRQQQGHGVQFIGNDGNALQIREKIRAIAKSNTLKFIVLVGAAPPPQANDALRARCTPTFRLPSQIGRYWGGGTEFVSDNPFADLDDDGVPELAIGRITAHSAGELTAIVQKILTYEDSHDFGAWRARINFVAGEGGYGASIDSALESVVPKAIGCELPAGYESTLTDAKWRSPFCPNPHRFHQCSLDRMNEGCLFWVFMGHGAPATLQWALFPDGRTPILRSDDCCQLHCKAPPIVMCMCCYTGDFGEQNDCLAEELLRAPAGPVAVFSGSNVTMPYGMAALARQAIHEYFDQNCDTLGEWLLRAKRDTMAGYDRPIWSLLHAATVAAAPEGFDLKQERLEHLQLFNLFGDPTMQLVHPQNVAISAPETAIAGRTVDIRAECSVSGNAIVQLVTPLDGVRAASRDCYDGSSKGRDEFEAMYQSVNNSRLASIAVEAKDGSFSAALPVPETAAGRYCIRVFVKGNDSFAIGGSRIQVAAPMPDRDNSAESAVVGKASARAIDNIEHR